MGSQCRTCMLLVDKNSAVGIFAFKSGEEMISDMLMQFAPVMISEEDNLPKIICLNCFQKLTVSYGFRKSVMTSDRGLRQKIAKFQNDVDEDDGDKSELVDERLIDFSLSNEGDEGNLQPCSLGAIDQEHPENSFECDMENVNSQDIDGGELDTPIEANSFSIDDKIEFEFAELKPNNLEEVMEHQDSQVKMDQEQSLLENEIVIEEVRSTKPSPAAIDQPNQRHQELVEISVEISVATTEIIDLTPAQPNERHRELVEIPVEISVASTEIIDLTEGAENKTVSNCSQIEKNLAQSAARYDSPKQDCFARWNGYELTKKFPRGEDSQRNSNCGESVRPKQRSSPNSPNRRDCSRKLSVEELHHCFICDKSFLTKPSLDLHFQTHTLDQRSSRCLNVPTISMGMTLECGKCHRRFYKQSHLHRHMKSHEFIGDSQIKLHQCQYCNKNLPSKVSLTRHLNALHLEKKLHKCSRCSRRFYENHDLETHNCSQYCKECDTVFGSKKSLDHHVVNFHLNTYECDVCSTSFIREDRWKSHMMIHKPHLPDSKLLSEQNEPFQCNECDLSFTQDEVFKTHMTMHPKSFFCGECSKRFHSKSARNSHFLVHLRGKKGSSVSTPIKQYQCTKCNIEFRTKSQLDHHDMQVHVKKLLGCTKCTKTFEKKCLLRYHMREHISKEQHRCLQCTENFSTKFQLARHTIVHSCDKRYQCPDCDNKYAQVKALRAHILDLVYFCRDCGLQFCNKYNLTTHMMIHGNPYQCQACSRRFQTETELKTHISTHPSDVLIVLD